MVWRYGEFEKEYLCLRIGGDKKEETELEVEGWNEKVLSSRSLKMVEGVRFAWDRMNWSE